VSLCRCVAVTRPRRRTTAASSALGRRGLSLSLGLCPQVDDWGKGQGREDGDSAQVGRPNLTPMLSQCSVKAPCLGRHSFASFDVWSRTERSDVCSLQGTLLLWLGSVSSTRSPTSRPPLCRLAALPPRPRRRVRGAFLPETRYCPPALAHGRALITPRGRQCDSQHQDSLGCARKTPARPLPASAMRLPYAHHFCQPHW